MRRAPRDAWAPPGLVGLSGAGADGRVFQPAPSTPRPIFYNTSELIPVRYDCFGYPVEGALLR